MGESINFDKLQQEFDKAVASDAKYSRENDAKFRAIHQKVQNLAYCYRYLVKPPKCFASEMS